MASKRGSRSARPIASDLFAAGWLPPRAAAARLEITVAQLELRAKRGDIKRRSIGPGVWLYEIGGSNG